MEIERFALQPSQMQNLLNMPLAVIRVEFQQLPQRQRPELRVQPGFPPVLTGGAVEDA